MIKYLPYIKKALLYYQRELMDAIRKGDDDKARKFFIAINQLLPIKYRID